MKNKKMTVKRLRSLTNTYADGKVGVEELMRESRWMSEQQEWR